MRIYGYDLGQQDVASMYAIQAFFTAMDEGRYVWDDSILLRVVDPLEQAISLCRPDVKTDLVLAKEDRDDYMNDYNFLRFLKTI